MRKYKLDYLLQDLTHTAIDVAMQGAPKDISFEEYKKLHSRISKTVFKDFSVFIKLYYKKDND